MTNTVYNWHFQVQSKAGMIWAFEMDRFLRKHGDGTRSSNRRSRSCRNTTQNGTGVTPPTALLPPRQRRAQEHPIRVQELASRRPKPGEMASFRLDRRGPTDLPQYDVRESGRGTRVTQASYRRDPRRGRRYSCISEAKKNTMVQQLRQWFGDLGFLSLPCGVTRLRPYR